MFAQRSADQSEYWMHGVAPSTLCPYKGTLPHPRRNEGRTQAGTDWRSTCIVPPFTSLQSIKSICFYSMGDGCWRVLAEDLSPIKTQVRLRTSSLRHVLASPRSIGLPKHQFSFQQLLPTRLCTSLNSTLHSPASWVFTFSKGTLKLAVTPTYSSGGQPLCWPESR